MRGAGRSRAAAGRRGRGGEGSLRQDPLAPVSVGTAGQTAAESPPCAVPPKRLPRCFLVTCVPRAGPFSRPKLCRDTLVCGDPPTALARETPLATRRWPLLVPSALLQDLASRVTLSVTAAPPAAPGPAPRAAPPSHSTGTPYSEPLNFHFRTFWPIHSTLTPLVTSH